MKKTLALVSVLALTACGSPPPPESFTPLDYSYLKPIVFNVANLNIVNNYIPTPDETQLNANNPAPPATTLLAMLNHRLQPGGTPGNGTVTVQVASITEAAGMLNGQMTVDINLSSADGRSTGFAEASVSASAAAPDADADQNDQQAALYQMTKKLMDSMNVQLPYTIAHNIPNWVSWTNPQGGGIAPAPGIGGGGAPGGIPGGIQATPLTAPPGAEQPVPNTLPSGGTLSLPPAQ